jgi:hypothetical protein
MGVAMRPRTDDALWEMLEAQAHLTDVQEVIRQAIRSGAIRVAARGEGIKITPCRAPDPEGAVRREAQAAVRRVWESV